MTNFRDLAKTILLLGFLASCSWVQAADPVLRAPTGFSVRLFADDDMAHDIYCMTVDSRGRVAVSGAGYVRLLHDDDRDGRADRATTFVDGPRTGAQGMYFDGTDLLCVGDGGLLRYRDRNGDGRADGPGELLLPLRTGGEHHAHAVRRGPDGRLYLIAGNTTGIDGRYITSPHSPVQDPQAGVLMRIAPWGESVEVVCDGLRNAYDFDFDSMGHIYVYDSDDERDVSFPWYRPTRVFQVMPGATAGWISGSWKLPDYAYDLMPVVASLGRGSPTGVVCYRHSAFPAKYQGAIFVADWTFGRVVAVWPQYDATIGRWSASSELFLTSDGAFGFAPTDLVVGADGELYVSVGGRGTRGGVFRVTWNGPRVADSRPCAVDSNGRCTDGTDAPDTPPGLPIRDVPLDARAVGRHVLADVLALPDPLAPWSRRQWEPRALQIGARPLRDAVLDPQLPTPWRVRAIEIVCELFGGLPADVHLALRDATPELRGRAAWCWGHTGTGEQPHSFEVTRLYLSDPQPLVVRALLEGLTGHPIAVTWLADERLLGEWLRIAGHPARDVRQQMARLLRAAGSETMKTFAARWDELSLAGKVTVAEACCQEPSLRNLLVRNLCRSLHKETDKPMLLDALRVVQRLLSDVGPVGHREAVFDGYAPRNPQSVDDTTRQMLLVWLEEVYPTGCSDVDHELERLAAMLEAASPRLRARILEACTPTSWPIDDVHRLVVLGRLAGQWTPEELNRLAQVWATVEEKIAKHQLRQDRHWPLRWQELLKVYAQRDPQFLVHLIRQPAFGHPAHAYCLPLVPSDLRRPALQRFWSFLERNPEISWPGEVIMAAAESDGGDRQRLIHRLKDRLDIDAILAALAAHPRAEERPWYWQGLRSTALPTILASLRAIEKLGPSDDLHEVAALISAMRKLEGDRAAYEAREHAARLLERIVPECFGFVFGPDGHRPQPEVLRAWRNWLESRSPELAESTFGSAPDASQVDQRLASVPWQQGDAERGQQLAQRKGCTKCHSSRYALGPDLAGAAQRFTRRDLFIAIAFPSAEVSPRYQTRIVETTDGRIIQGAVIYESVDGLTLATPDGQTLRVENAQIARQYGSSVSLMPAGLLDDCSPQDYADLFAWLQSLR